MKEIIGPVLMIIFVGIGFGSWLFAVVEMLLKTCFVRSVFNIGPAITKIEDKVSIQEFQKVSTEVLVTENAKYKIIDKNTCLFREKFRPFRFRVNTPLPMAGVISIKDGAIKLTGRVSLGLTIFTSFILIVWTISGVAMIFKGNTDLFSSIGFFLAGPFFALLMYFMSAPLEKRRFNTAFNEVREDLGFIAHGDLKNIKLNSVAIEIKHVFILIAIILTMIGIFGKGFDTFKRAAKSSNSNEKMNFEESIMNEE